MNSVLSIAINVIFDFLVIETVIAAVLVGIAWGMIRLGRIKAPVHRHMVWLFTLIAIVIMPVLWLYTPKLTLSILPIQNPIGAILLQEADFLSAWLADDYSYRALFSGINMIVWLWCAGFLFLTTRLILSGYRLSRIIDSSTLVSDDILPKKVLAGKIKLLLTSQVDSPVCLGLLRPLILLPEQMYYNSSREELRMMLRHEIAHIERKDCWVNLFQRIVEAFLFFHPLVWYASLQLTHQREQLCDNHVIADGISPTNYIKMLTRIVEQGFEKKCFHALALFEGKLLIRMRSLLEPDNTNQIKASRWATVAGVMVMFMFLVIGTVRIEAEAGISHSQGLIPREETVKQSEDWETCNLRDVDQRPSILYQHGPIYPFSATKEGIEGKVMIRATVDKDGYAREPEVVSAEPEGVFEEAALDAIAESRFKPAIKDGKRVDCVVILPIKFELPKEQKEQKTD
jgi:TonB family protein